MPAGLLREGQGTGGIPWAQPGIALFGGAPPCGQSKGPTRAWRALRLGEVAEEGYFGNVMETAEFLRGFRLEHVPAARPATEAPRRTDFLKESRVWRVCGEPRSPLASARRSPIAVA